MNGRPGADPLLRAMRGARPARLGGLLADRRGFTLPELLVAIGIFLVVMQITSGAFKTVLSHVGQQSKSLETDIGNLVGLELFRSDLQNAGFGLPFAFQSAPSASSYSEITVSDDTMPATATFWLAGTSPRSYNDAPGNAPRAVQSGNTGFNIDSGGLGSQYLVIKSMPVAPGATQRKWANVIYSDSGKTESVWGSAERDFDRSQGASERVLVMRSTFVDGNLQRELEVKDGAYSCLFRQYTTLTQPHAAGDAFQIYGVDPGTDPRMPFNRADYYVSRPAKPLPFCAPNTGSLFKAVANQGAGAGFSEMVLLDCVADMQVVYGIGPVGAAGATLYRNSLPGTGSARDIREQLKEIRVYLLAHEGKRDFGFTFPASSIQVGEEIGGTLVGRRFDLEGVIGANWQHYRWRLYTIVARPKNLIQ